MVYLSEEERKRIKTLQEVSLKTPNHYPIAEAEDRARMAMESYITVTAPAVHELDANVDTLMRKEDDRFQIAEEIHNLIKEFYKEQEGLFNDIGMP